MQRGRFRPHRHRRANGITERGGAEAGREDDARRTRARGHACGARSRGTTARRPRRDVFAARRAMPHTRRRSDQNDAAALRTRWLACRAIDGARRRRRPAHRDPARCDGKRRRRLDLAPGAVAFADCIRNAPRHVRIADPVELPYATFEFAVQAVDGAPACCIRRNRYLPSRSTRAAAQVVLERDGCGRPSRATQALGTRSIPSLSIARSVDATRRRNFTTDFKEARYRSSPCAAMRDGLATAHGP